ncbi:hypothetical protein IBX73_05910 [candidate division WOR-3 bacterium]|nr:hypothetical protein [candidate division WOR-3 bacterium]
MKRLCLVLISALFILHCTGESVLELIHPTDGELVTVPFTFIWSSVENSIDYRIEVDTDIAFSSPVIATDVSDTTYDAANLDTLMYYWRVAAYDENDGLGGFTDPDSFRVTGSAYPRNFLTAITVLSSAHSIDITPNGNEVWVNHNGQYDTMVYVISTVTNQVTHQIPVSGSDGAELQITQDGQFAYFCAGSDHAGIVEINTSTHTHTRTFNFYVYSWPEGPDGYGIATTQNNSDIFAAHAAADYGYGCITKFNVSTGALIDSTHLPWICDVALNHAGTKLYAVSESDDIFYEIDPATLTVTNQMSVLSNPRYLAITADDDYAFISHLNSEMIYVVDLNAFSLVTTIDATSGHGHLRFTPDQKYLYALNHATRTMNIIDVSNPSSPFIVENLNLGGSYGALKSICFSPDGMRAYIVASQGNIVVLTR